MLEEEDVKERSKEKGGEEEMMELRRGRKEGGMRA